MELSGCLRGLTMSLTRTSVTSEDEFFFFQKTTATRIEDKFEIIKSINIRLKQKKNRPPDTNRYSMREGPTLNHITIVRIE